VHSEPWPEADPTAALDTRSVTVVVQVMGKKRAVVELPLEIDNEGAAVMPSKQQLLDLAYLEKGVMKFVGDRQQVAKEVVVLPKTLGKRPCMVNLVLAKKPK